MDPKSTAALFTPGDAYATAHGAATPWTGTLNTNAGAPVHTPVVGVLLVVGAALLLERRRIRLFGRK